MLPGCKKKEETSAAPPVPPANAESAASPVAAPAANAPATFDANKYFADTDAALKAKEYDKAVQSLFALQQQRLTDQQAQAAHNRMIQIQSSLAGAVLSGDPRARAAAEMIRNSSKH